MHPPFSKDFNALLYSSREKGANLTFFLKKIKKNKKNPEDCSIPQQSSDLYLPDNEYLSIFNLP
nr:MAG TPA: hypothetical protein [Caudoviricetes sp.]